MAVHELASISFSINPVTSQSLLPLLCHSLSPIVSLSYLLSLLSIIITYRHFVPFFISDLFCPFYVPNIIPRFCGWIIIVQHLCILVARQLAYCICGLMICFLSNTLLLYLEYFIYHYLCSWIYNELLPYSKTSVLNWTRYLLKFNSTASLSLLN